MVGDREAMSLIARSLEELQGGGGVVEHERRAATREE
jgi:hypothetical protein